MAMELGVLEGKITRVTLIEMDTVEAGEVAAAVKEPERVPVTESVAEMEGVMVTGAVGVWDSDSVVEAV